MQASTSFDLIQVPQSGPHLWHGCTRLSADVHCKVPLLGLIRNGQGDVASDDLLPYTIQFRHAHSPTSGAAGGCILVRRITLGDAAGLTAMWGALNDDCASGWEEAIA